MRPELQSLPQFLEVVLDSLPANIAILDEAGTIVAVNASWRRFADDNGLDWPDHGVGTDYLECVMSASGDSAQRSMAVIKGMQELMAGQCDQLSLECPLHIPLEKRWFELRAKRLRTSDGIWFVATHQDITARKRAEQALPRAKYAAQAGSYQEETGCQAAAFQTDATLEELRESEETFRIVTEQSPNMIFINVSGRVMYANKKCQEILGYTREEFYAPDFDFLCLIAPEYQELVKDNFRRHMQGENVRPYEYALVTKDGRRVEAIIASKQVSYGGESAILGTVTDITERKQVEQILRESETRFWDLYHNAPVAYFSLGTDGLIYQCNRRAAELLGYALEELIGKPMSRLYGDTPYGKEKSLEVFKRFLAGERVRNEELQMQKADGTPVWISLTMNAIHDGDGRIVESRAMVVDIAERKQAEQTLQQAKEVAETARREEQARRQEAERRHQIAAGLSDVLAALNSNQPLEDVLDLIATQAGRLLDTRAVGIYSLEAEVGTLAIEVAKGLLVTYVAGSNIPIGYEALRHAMVSSQLVAVPDVNASPVSTDTSGLDAQHPVSVRSWESLYRAWLAVPIVGKDEVYGGMLLYYTEPRLFSEDEVELAVAFADQAALAIENSRLRDQIEQAAATAERDRLARELHDAVTQTLFSASLIAEALPRVWRSHPEVGQSGLEELRQLTRGALAEMRALLVELRPTALTEKPLGELLRHLTEATTGRTRVPVALTIEGHSSLSPDLQIALYRIAQEALNNVAKHSGASQASVDLRCQPGQVTLQVSDDGRGFNPGDVLPDRLGMGIMRERAEAIGASLEVNSQPGHGTHVVVNWQGDGGSSDG